MFFPGVTQSGRSGSVRVPRAAFDLPYDVKRAVGDFFGADDEVKAEVPPDVAAIVDGLKASTQEALNQGISRLDVEVPPAFKFGVEGNKGRLLDVELNDDARDDIARSDRELARLFVEMLQPIAAGLCVAFRNRALASAATKAWKLQRDEGHIISFPEKARSTFAAEVGAPMSFKKKLGDLGCQCLVVVAPYLDQLRLVKEIGSELGDQMGIILLNSRIHGRGRKTLKMPPAFRNDLRETFVPSYHLRFFPEPKNALIFHMLAGDTPERAPWILARQRELIGGRPVTEEVLRTRKEPSAAKAQKAFEEFMAKDKGLGGKLLDALDKESLSGLG